MDKLEDSSIALFFPTFTPGGIERCFLNLAEGFLEQGIAVDIVVADRRGSFESQIPNGVRVIDLRAGRVLKSVVPLIKYLRRYSPDVLLSGHTHANIVAVWSAKLSFTDTRVAIGVHNTLSQSRDNRSLKSKFVGFSFPIVYQYADFIIAVSKGAADDIIQISKLTPKDIEVIYNPVIGSEFTALMNETVSHPWFSDPSTDVILGVGRLVEQKDFITLISAFDQIQQSNPNARLVIVGQGKEANQLDQFIKSRGLENEVQIISFIENLYAMMNYADIFVLSSRWEGFGIVLVEAMATGTPVVSTDCPNGPAEILRGGEFGALTPVADEDALASAIEKTLLDPIDSSKLVDRAMDFEQSVIVNEYLSVLFNLDDN